MPCIATASKSIEELREEIDKELENVESPIVVFIDDVDRLSKEEIKHSHPIENQPRRALRTQRHLTMNNPKFGSRLSSAI